MQYKLMKYTYVNTLQPVVTFLYFLPSIMIITLYLKQFESAFTGSGSGHTWSECHGMNRQIPAAMEPAKQKHEVQSFHYYTVVVQQSLAGAKNREYILTKYVITIVYIL